MDNRDFTIFGTTFRGPRIVRSELSNDARKHLRRSPWLAIAAFSIDVGAGVLTGSPLSSVLGFAMLTAYVVWATYWGFLGFLRFSAWAGDSKLFGLASEWVTGNFYIYGLVLGPLIAGGLYGVLGGWCWEFARAWKVARDPNASVE